MIPKNVSMEYRNRDNWDTPGEYPVLKRIHYGKTLPLKLQPVTKFPALQ